MSEAKEAAKNKLYSKLNYDQYVSIAKQTATIDGVFTADELAEICDILNMED